jgi:hypothetical protein
VDSDGDDCDCGEGSVHGKKKKPFDSRSDELHYDSLFLTYAIMSWTISSFAAIR